MTISTSQPTAEPKSRKLNDPWDSWSFLLAARVSDVKLLSAPLTTDTENNHREFLDEEIAAVSAVLAYLKERRNALYRKPRLPVETMELIFAYAALNEVPGQRRIQEEAGAAWPFHARRPGCYHPVSALGWVRLTHVCRAWRAIALSNANKQLWAAMDVGGLSATGVREIIKRSHPHPVAATITISMHRDHRTPSAVLFEPECLPRLTSLRVVADTARIPQKHLIDPGIIMAHYRIAILDMLADKAWANFGLMIESLIVEDGDANNWDHVLRLPSKLWLPRLRHLVLRNARPSCSWGYITYPQLTHLEITTGSLHKGPMNLTIAGFVSFLRGAPYLQILRLSGSFPQLAGVYSVDGQHMEMQRVHLPHLKELYLQGTLYDCTQFARHLSPPTSCSITVDASGDSNPSYEFLGPMLQRWARSSIWRARTPDLGREDVSGDLEVWYTTPDARMNTDALDGCILPSCTPRIYLAGLPRREPRRAQMTADQVRFWGTVAGSIAPGYAVYPLRVYARNEVHRDDGSEGNANHDFVHAARPYVSTRLTTE